MFYTQLYFYNSIAICGYSLLRVYFTVPVTVSPPTYNQLFPVYPLLPPIISIKEVRKVRKEKVKIIDIYDAMG